MTYLFIILLFLTGKSVLLWQRGVDVLTAQSLMVSPDHRYKLLADHTLEIRNIKPSDGGDYACKISVLGDPIEIKHTLEILRKSFFGIIFSYFFLEYFLSGLLRYSQNDVMAKSTISRFL